MRRYYASVGAVKLVERLAHFVRDPDIGRAAQGFEFLGYRLSPRGLAVAQQTRERFAARAARLQEQERAGRKPPGTLGAYVRRWRCWAQAGLAGL